MTDGTRERLFGYEHAFEHPVTVGIVVAITALLAVAPLLVLVLARSGKISAATRSELLRRSGSWAVLAPILVVPIVLGAASTMLLVAVLCVLSWAEFARATGVFREKLVSGLVVVAFLAQTFAVVDHWYGFFVALPSLTVVVLAIVSILPDRPRGYLQRFALGVLGYFLFGVCLSHLGYWANDRDYRPALLLVLVAVELNDVFAYLWGRTFGRRRLAPNTSPNKTLAGALGAFGSTVVLVVLLGGQVFAESALDTTLHLVILGAIISVGGQCGDLMLSSVKRDLGIKDMGAILPGHGGLLDRFDSLILVAPATFHYVHWIAGIGVDEVPRIITGG